MNNTLDEKSLRDAHAFNEAACKAIDHPDARQAKQLKGQNGLAQFVCPVCTGRAFVKKAHNGHRHAYCSACGIRFME